MKAKIAKRGGGLAVVVAGWKAADTVWGIASLMSDIGWIVTLGVTGITLMVGPEIVRFARSVPARIRDRRATPRTPAAGPSTFERHERHGKPYWVGPDGRTWVLPDDLAADLAHRPSVAMLERRLRTSTTPEGGITVKLDRRAIAAGLVARFMAENPDRTAGDFVEAHAADRWVKSYVLRKVEGE